MLPRQIANAHSIFNLTVSVFLFPFVKPIAKLPDWLMPEKTENVKAKTTAFINEKQYAVPSLVINEASRELFRLGEITVEIVDLGCQSLLAKDMEKAERVIRLETQVDEIIYDLEHFINVLMRADLLMMDLKHR